jgi:hypothetical protein
MIGRALIAASAFALLVIQVAYWAGSSWAIGFAVAVAAAMFVLFVRSGDKRSMMVRLSLQAAVLVSSIALLIAVGEWASLVWFAGLRGSAVLYVLAVAFTPAICCVLGTAFLAVDARRGSRQFLWLSVALWGLGVGAAFVELFELVRV